MIECRGLGKRYAEKIVVEGLDLHVERGEILVLIGASGSGKSTILKMINRLVEPSEGRIWIDGEDTSGLVPFELRRRIGYGSQHAGLFPHFDIAHNVGNTARLLGWPRDRIESRVDALLARVELDPASYRARFPATLSGGEQQRVNLARAMAAEPALLLLDEPFGALDPVTRDQLQEALVEIVRESGLTVVFVTHDMSEALLLADRIAVLERGRIAQLGTPAALLRDPATDSVRAFLRAPRRQAARIDDLVAQDGRGAPGSSRE
jgi:osmoprotectant transport system ATP-binding protein